MRQRHADLCRQLAGKLSACLLLLQYLTLGPLKVVSVSVVMSDESAAHLTPKQLGQINRELRTLQPVVDALRILSEQRQEVWHGTLFCDERLYEFLCKGEGAYHLPDARPDILTLMTVMMAGLSCRLTAHSSDLYFLQLRQINLNASNG